MEKEERIKIGITPGNGDEYSYQVLAKAFSENALFDIALPYAYGKLASMQEAVKQAKLNEFSCASVAQWQDIKGKKPLIFESGDHPYLALQQAMDHLKSEHLKSLVTLPVLAEKLQEKSPEFKTMAHYLASNFRGSFPFRMFLLDNMRLSFITSVKMDRLEERINSAKLKTRIQSLYNVLQSDFGITTPRIAVLSVNTDIESESLCEGDKEVQEVTASFIERGMPVFGPYAPKVFFADGLQFERTIFHAVLCIYREQLDVLFNNYNVDRMCVFTAGLPFVHIESNYEIGSANIDAAATNLWQAIYNAVDIERCRASYAELTSNPLYIADRNIDEGD